MYLPAIVMVGYYFDKRRALATGIAVCGSGIGSFVFAPLSEGLLRQYGWKGAMWILSALSLNGVVFAALFRPLEFVSSPEEDEVCDEELVIFEEPNADGRNPLIKRLKNEPNALYRSHSVEACNEVSKESEIARLGHSMFLDSEPRSRKHAKGRPHVLRPLERKDIFYSGSIQHLPEYTEAGNEDKFVKRMLKKDESEEKGAEISKNVWSQFLKDTFDTSLLKSPTFVLYGLSCFLCMIGKFYI